MKAYIKADLAEDPEVLSNLYERLKIHGIEPILTDTGYKNIPEKAPFLFYRNAYLRFNNEDKVLKYHYDNPNTPYISTVDNEVVSYSPVAGGTYNFVINAQTSTYEPKQEPLPILLGTHQRPLYLKLTINSLLHTANSSRQKIYLVVSQPDPETLAYVQTLLDRHSNIQAVLSDNLRYAFANFGSKFFGLKRFVHHEDDGIIPENVGYYLPYWTSQLHHRSLTADLVTFRISEGNWTSAFLKSPFLLKSNRVVIPPEALWHYTKPAQNTVTPIGGMGMVIDSPRMYKGFKPPNYSTSDHNLYYSANAICIANVPIYHVGANYMMDYPQYAAKKADTKVERYFTGVNLRTKESQKIDLAADWIQYSRPES